MKRMKKYEQFINDKKINEAGLSAEYFMSPEFLTKVANILNDRGELPERYRDSFNLSANKDAEEQVGDRKDLGVNYVLGKTDKEIENDFDKLPTEEKEARDKIAMVTVDSEAIEKPEYSKIGKWDYKESKIGTHKYSDYVKLLKNKGIWNEIEKEKWTLLGLRISIDKRKEYLNGFIDEFVLIKPNEKKAIKFAGTTFPGLAYRVKPYRSWWISRGVSWLASKPASEGLAIMQEGKNEFEIIQYKGSPALSPIGGVNIKRYPLVDKPEQVGDFRNYSPGKTETGNRSILIHEAKESSNGIDAWSAGCQVIKDPKDMQTVIEKTKRNNNRIDYFLIQI